MNEKEMTREELRVALDGLRARVAELEGDRERSRHSEEALRESEELYRTLFDHTPIEIIIVDQQARVVGYNKTKKISGARLPEIGAQMYVGYAARHEIPMHQELRNCLREKQIKEFPEQRYGERYLHIRMAPFSGGAIITSIDITKRKLIENDLLESNRRFRELSELLPQVVYESDVSGKILYVNRFAFETTGYTAEDFRQGLSTIDFVAPEDRERARNNYKRILAGAELKGSEYLFQRKDGSLFPVIVYSSPVISGGNVVGLRGIIIDITERQKREEEFRRAHKLESLGVLAGGIAHDFNNLLTAILGNISLAKIYAKPGDQIYERLSEAEAAAIRSKDLTRQLLTFSKGGEPLKKKVAVAEFIQDASRFVLLGSNVRCEYLLPDDLWLVNVDSGQIKQAVQNIILNADQAMSGGGVVLIEAANVVVAEDEQQSLASGSYVKLTITDQGPGIAKKDLGRIFDPYFSTKEVGCGLGLSIVYSVVKNHGGRVTVDSESGQGTTFTLYLPALLEGNQEQKEKTGGAEGDSCRILVMDDEDFIRTVAANMLQHLGYEVEVAEDGSEAIKLYQEAGARGRPFDAVIMDLTIPGGMGGREAIDRLKKLDPDVKAIVSSGYANDPIMSDYRNYGFCGVVPKPYRIETMKDALLEIIGRG